MMPDDRGGDVFSQGDCWDAALGTVLIAKGCERPGTLLFGSCVFVSAGTHVDGSALVEIRNDATVEKDLQDWLDVVVVDHQTWKIEIFVETVTRILRSGSIAILTIDHAKYPRSHLYRKANLPHKILAMRLHDDGRVAYLDPFRPFLHRDTVEFERLQEWVRVRNLMLSPS